MEPTRDGRLSTWTNLVLLPREWMKITVSTSTDHSTFNLDFLLEELLSTLVAILSSRHGKWAEPNNNGYSVTTE